MKFSTVFGEAFVRSSNLRLCNSFEPFWKNEGKTSHSLKEMPSNCFTTCHIKQITRKSASIKIKFHYNAIFL
jgi:hypothetical protein